MARRPDPGRDHGVDRGGEADAEVAATDAEQLAGLCSRRLGPAWPLFLGIVFLLLGAGQALLGTLWIGVAYLVMGVGQLVTWWFDPRPSIRSMTPEAILVRRGRRTQTITPADLLDVVPRYTGPYGVELTVRDAEPIRLDGTAQMFSVAAAQAAALRRWAGLDR